MSNHSLTRREFLKLGATGAAMVALSQVVGVHAADEPVDEVSSSTQSGSAIATNKNIKIEAPNETIRYDIIDNHLHFTDFLEESDGFPALVKAMDLAGVEKAVVFGMPIAKQFFLQVCDRLEPVNPLPPGLSLIPFSMRKNHFYIKCFTMYYQGITFVFPVYT